MSPKGNAMPKEQENPLIAERRRKLEALRTFTLAMVRDRGNVSEAQMQAFFDAGYDHRAVLNVILALAQKVMSNYVNHLVDTPVDEVFQKFEWKKAS